MAVWTQVYTFVAGQVPTATNWNANPSSLETLLSGAVDKANVDSTSSDGIQVLDVNQTVTGTRTFTGAVTVSTTLTVGADDTGYDVQLFGATSGKYLLWDESADELKLVGGAKLSVSQDQAVAVTFGDTTGGNNGYLSFTPNSATGIHRITAADDDGNTDLILQASNSGTAKDYMLVKGSTGLVIIGDGSKTSSTDITLGALFDQRDNDDAIVGFASSDVAHGMTNNAETNVYGLVSKAEATSGGLKLTGYKDADGSAGAAMFLDGNLGEAADTTKSTAAVGIIKMNARVKSGSGTGNVGADGNLAVLVNNSTTRFIFDAEGSGHADVEWTTYDAHDDVQLIRDMEEELLLHEDAAKTARRRHLEKVGIIGEDSWHMENGRPRAMINFTKLSMLHHGALIQMGGNVDLLNQVARLLAEGRNDEALKLLPEAA